MKKNCFIAITYDGGNGGCWSTNCTAESVAAKVADFCKAEYRGSQQLTPPRKMTELWLRVILEEGELRVYAEGTDGYEKVEERALELFARAKDNFTRLHDGHEKRALIL